MLRKTFFGIFFLLFFSNIAFAQYTEVYGKVIDGTTKEPIPYVNIRVVGTIRTTVTSPKGEFHIKFIEKADSISFTYIGYKTRVVPIKRGKVEEVQIEMGTEEMKLVEVTVKAGKQHHKRMIDTVANYVYYEVLKNKDKNRDESVNTYRYDSYEKMLFSLLNTRKWVLRMHILHPFSFAFHNTDTTHDGNVFIPGIIKETVSEVYYRRHPKSIRRYIKGEHISGIDNSSIMNLAAFQFSEINVYDNLFVIATASFVAPFSPSGINIYHYFITDTQKIEGRISYKLYFVGKVREDLALKGFAWIDSATWAIRSINFRPNEKANINFINDYSIAQQYTFVNDKHWMLSREELTTVGSLLKKKIVGGILVQKIMDRKNFQTDIEIPDSVFKGADDRVLLDSARERPLAFFDSLRMEKLTRQEREVYHIDDTIKTIPAWKTMEWFLKYFTTAYAEAGPIEFGRFLNFVSRNNVEGWRLRFGFETNTMYRPHTKAHEFLHQAFFSGYVAYGLKDKDFKYQAIMRFTPPLKNDNWQLIEALYRYDMRVPGQEEGKTPLTFDNFATIISGKTLSKIMKVREFRLVYEREWRRGFSTSFTFNPKTYYDIPGVFDFKQVQGDIVRRIPNFNVTEFVVDSRYSKNEQYYVGSSYRFFFLTKNPIFMLRLTSGLVNLQGDYFTFENIRATIKQRISSPIGHTNFTLQGGKILGKAPYPVCYLTQGNFGRILDKFNYNLLRDFEFVTDQYVSFWFEHHFEGFIFNKIPGFNKLRLREAIVFKSLIGTMSQRNKDVLVIPTDLSSPFPYPYIETGFAIENILNLFRVDFLWRATYRNKLNAPNWGIKFAFEPGF